MAVCWIVASSPHLQNCIQKEQAKSANQHFQSDVTQILVSYRACIGGFVHDNAEGIIAVFTIILAISTIFLWSATRDLVIGTENVARNQLRAYVFIDGGSMDLTDGKTMKYSTELPTIQEGVFIRAHLVFKNFGQTPAYEFMVWRQVDVLDAINPRFAEIGKGITKDVIGPGGTSEITAQRPVTPEQYAAIKDGTKFIYCWGRIEYVDAFQKRQHFEFYSRNGLRRIDGWTLETAEHCRTTS